MKHISKIILTVTAAVFALGVIMTAVSLITGGSLRHIRDNIGISNYSEYLEADEIREIRVELTTGIVTFREGENFGVAALNTAEAYFSCEVKSGVLTVKESRPQSGKFAVSRVVAAENATPQIVVFVPSGFADPAAGTSVSVKADVGSCIISDMAFSKLRVDIGTGLTELSVPGSVFDYNINGMVGLGTVTVGETWFRGNCNYSNENPAAGREIGFSCLAGDVKIRFSE